MGRRAGAASSERLRAGAPRLAVAAAAIALLAGTGPARAVTLDFDDLASGTLVSDQYTSASHPGLATGQGFAISVSNSGGGVDAAALYDSGLSGGEDPDLEGPPAGSWSGGNLASPQAPLGNLLIVQESATASELTAGVLSHASGASSQGPGFAPDDEAGGGTLTFAFESQQVAFAFDFVDVDDPAGYEIAFTDTTTGETLALAFADLEDPGSGFYDPGIDWADSHANRVQTITAAALSAELGGTLDAFDEVTFTLDGSGGIASVTYVPEPTPLMLLALGLGGLARLGRRRRASPPS